MLCRCILLIDKCKAGSTVRYGLKLRYGTKFFGLKVRFEITVWYIFPGTVRFESTIFFSNLFRTNLIIERRPLRYVSNQDLCRFRHAVSMKYSKLYRVVHIVQKKKRSPNPFPACLSSIGASYRWPSWRAHSQDFGLYKAAFLRGGFLKAENNLSIISVFVDFFLKEARAFLGGGALSPQSTSPSPRLRACFQGDEWVSAWWQARNQDFQREVLFGGKVDLKPKGGLIWEKSGLLYYTLWSLYPKGGLRPPPPPPPATGLGGLTSLLWTNIMGQWSVARSDGPWLLVKPKSLI